MTEPVVSVHDLAKRYSRQTRSAISHGMKDILREMSGRSRPEDLRRDEFWAVDGVTFDVNPGDSLGVIGVNGAGKTTLLRLIYGLTKPDRGGVVVRGRVAGLLDLGSGFDPRLTGRENILAGAAVHQIPQRQIEEKLESIVAFADIGHFIDAPVRTYSNGMLLRLGYSIVAHIDADVLLVDETLSVGDFAFQRKCASHVRRFVEGGGALVLVSHSVWMVKGLCDRGLVLDAGQVSFAGTAEDAVEHYLEVEALPSTMEAMADNPVDDREPAPVTVEAVRLEPVAGDDLLFGAPARLEVDYHSTAAFDPAAWGFVLWTGDGAAAVAGNLTGEDETVTIREGRGHLRCEIPALPLARGAYEVRLVVFDGVTKVLLGLHGYEDTGTQVVVSGPATDPRLTRIGGAPLTHVPVTWSTRPSA